MRGDWFDSAAVSPVLPPLASGDTAPMPRPRTALLALGVALATLALQLPGLSGPFVWDDIPMLERSDLYTHPARLSEALTHTLGKATYYWRPLATTSFLADALLHGSEPWGFRLTNALLHAATAVLVFLAARNLLRSPAAAALAALAWALHPVQVETVTWISCRFDLLSGLAAATALALLGTDGSVGAAWRRAGLVAAAALGLASKENAVVLIVVVPCVAGALAEGELRERLPSLRGAAEWIAGGMGATFVARYALVGSLLGANPASAEAAGEGLPRLLLIGRALATYLHALAFPWGVVGPTHHAARPIPADDLLGWTGLLLGASLAALTLWALRRRPRTGLLLVAFGAAISPVLQFVPLDLAGGLHAADRFLYLPSILGVLVVADLLHALAPRRVAAGVGLVLVLSFAVGRSVILPRWGDPVRLWTWSVGMAPHSSTPYLNLIRVQRRGGNLDAAEVVARELVARHPQGGFSVILAQVLEDSGRTTEAVEVILAAPAPDPPNPGMTLAAAHLLLDHGRPDAAYSRYESVLRTASQAGFEHLSRFVPDALSGAAESAAVQGKDVVLANRRLERAESLVVDERIGSTVRLLRARIALRDSAGSRRIAADVLRTEYVPSLLLLIERAAEELPDDAQLREILDRRAEAAGAPRKDVLWARARGLADKQSFAAAAAAFEELVALLPEDPAVRDQYGYVLFGAGRPEESEREIRRALELDPRHALARYHLGLLLAKTGREAQAQEAFAQARRDAEGADAGLVQAIERELR